jgi:DNA-binding MarR family transcriptional regulator
MKNTIERSKTIVEKYNEMNSEYGLTPTEYMVWTALITACTKIYLETKHSNSVSIADVCREINLSPKIVQKNIEILEVKGLAKRMHKQWVYVPVKSATDDDKNSNGTIPK